MTASAPDDTMSNDSSGTPSGQKHSPPPEYNETDPMDTVKSPVSSSPRSPHPSTEGGVHRSDSKPANTRKPRSGSFIKGLLPMTMAPEMSDDGSTDEMATAYNYKTDPLLQDDSTTTSKNMVGMMQKATLMFFSKNHNFVWRVITAIVLAGYTFWLGFAVAYSPYGAIAPLVFTGLAFLFASYHYIKKYFGKQINDAIVTPFADWFNRNWYIFKWFIYPAPLIAFVLYLSLEMAEIKQLQSLSGFVFFFCYLWLTSKHPNKVVWRPVLWGYTLQFIMGVLVLKWDKGYAAVEWLSGYITKFINFGFAGAAVIYGDPTMILHPFLMMGMSLIIYVGAVMAILYYLGITQLIASKMAWGLAKCMGTTAIETLGVVSNIFLNGMDVMLMLRPYLHKLTMSEFNCFLVGNMTTIAGFMFGLLILYGAPPEHLLTAAVMSSPAAIAIAKLNYPETVPEKSITRHVEEIRLSRGTERNLFEAAANGSAIAGKTAMTVCVNYISFISLLYFLDAVLIWTGERIGYPDLTFETICGYLFFPIALLVGIDISQCLEVGKVIGLKVFTTEIYAYQRLGQIYNLGLIDDRSKALGTYAICGFSSLSTVAIAVGVWEVVCPRRRPLMSKLMLRVLIQANIGCFTTACVAGMFYSEDLAMVDSAKNRDPVSQLVVFVLSQLPSLF